MGMLVLSRKLNEVIDITLPNGQVITVKVVDLRRDKVRIGVAAKSDVRIDRHEVSKRRREKAHE